MRIRNIEKLKIEGIGNSYYRVTNEKGSEFIISVDNFTKVNVEEIEEALKVAELPSYLKNKYSSIEEIIEEGELNDLFELKISPSKEYYWAELSPSNYSLFEYLKLVKGQNTVPDALKSAYISKSFQEGTYSIACESYDDTSMINSRNVSIIEKYVHILKDELSLLMGVDYTHMEVY